VGGDQEVGLGNSGRRCKDGGRTEEFEPPAGAMQGFECLHGFTSLRGSPSRHTIPAGLTSRGIPGEVCSSGSEVATAFPEAEALDLIEHPVVVTPRGFGQILTDGFGIGVDRCHIDPPKAIPGCGGGPPIILGTKLGIHQLALLVIMDRISPAFDLGARVAVEGKDNEKVVVEAFLLMGLQHPDVGKSALTDGVQEAVEVAVRFAGTFHRGWEGEGCKRDVSQGVTAEEVVDGGPQEVEGFLDVLGDRGLFEGDKVIARENRLGLR